MARSKASSIQSRAAAVRAAFSASRWVVWAGVSAPPNQGASPLLLPTTCTAAKLTRDSVQATFSTKAAKAGSAAWVRRSICS
ncbi:MAG: hypothetical protein ACRD1K_19930 [Acidimicrobiales bacterium]